MKLSNNTVKILKNFSTINSGLVVKPGNLIRTISSNKTLLAEAKIEETFVREFGIYDLNKTLSLLAASDSHEVDVENEFLVFKGLNGSGTIRQRFTPTNLIVSPGDNKINLTKIDVRLTLTVDILQWIFNAASILRCPNIVIKSDDGKNISVLAVDVKGEIVDDASVSISGQANGAFQACLKIENLKIVMDEYNVEISSAGVCKLTAKNNNLTYWVSIEKNSSNFN